MRAQACATRDSPLKTRVTNLRKARQNRGWLPGNPEKVSTIGSPPLAGAEHFSRQVASTSQRADSSLAGPKNAKWHATFLPTLSSALSLSRSMRRLGNPHRKRGLRLDLKKPARNPSSPRVQWPQASCSGHRRPFANKIPNRVRSSVRGAARPELNRTTKYIWWQIPVA